MLRSELKDETEYKLLCLARELLNKSLYKRQTILKGFEKRNGKELTNKLKAVMKTERAIKKEAKLKAQNELRKLHAEMRQTSSQS